ncbi:hypothetical protein D3C81_1489700 [compost metagenome]
MLGHLRAAIGAEVEQGAVAQAGQSAQLRVLRQVLRAADRVDHVMVERMAAVARLDLAQFGQVDVRAHARLHRQEVLRRDQVDVDVRMIIEELRHARPQPQGGEGGRAAQGHHVLGVGVAADALGGLGDVDERQLHRIEED